MAKSRWAEKVTFLFLALAIVVLATAAETRPGHILLKFGILPLAAVMVFNAYRVWFLRLIFLRDEIRVTCWPFAHYCQTYPSITKIRAMPGNLQLRFRGGKKLNIASGQGDLSTILAILSDRTDVIPEVVGAEAPEVR